MAEASKLGIVLKNKFLLPTLKLDDQKFEFIFMLDVSGSMQGCKIELAKQALNLFLHSLPATCYFNVVLFNHGYSFMFSSSVKYSQETLDQAKARVSVIRASGGTDLLPPLEHVYRNPQIPGYLTQIFSITDGEVSQPDDVLKLVKSKVKHSRAFALGIGAGACRTLVNGIAREGGGFAEFVVENEQIQSKILHQLKVSLRPALLKPIRITPGSATSYTSFSGDMLLGF